MKLYTFKLPKKKTPNNLKEDFNLSRNNILHRNSLIGDSHLSNSNKKCMKYSHFQSCNMCVCLFALRRLPETYIQQISSVHNLSGTMYSNNISYFLGHQSVHETLHEKFSFHFVLLSTSDQLENPLLNH